MTIDVPDWVTRVPSSEGVHTAPARTTQWENLSQDQLRQLRQQLLESILAWVTQALTGLYLPGGGFGAAFDQLQGWAEDWQLVLGNLQSMFAALNFLDPNFDPEEALQIWTQGLTEIGLLLGFDSPLNSLNLYNLIPPHILGQINFSNIGETYANLIADPWFQISEAFDGLADWDYFPGLAHVGSGAAQTTADGTTHELLGNWIDASKGQVIDLSGWVKWTGLVGTGSPIALAVTAYNAAGDAVDTATVVNHNTIPTTTDWLNLAGVYTVPDGGLNIAGVRARLVVAATATAGTVLFDDISASKSQTMFQRLIAGTDPGDLLSDDIENLFTGIISNALEILNKTPLSQFNELLSTIGGSFGDDLAAAEDRLNDFLHSLSPLNGSNILSGSISDTFVPGIGTLHDAVVTAVGNLGGSGFDITKVLEVLTGQTHALVDHGAGIIDMYARMSQLESQFAALPISAGGTGSGNADGGLVGAIDTDTFERVSSSSLGTLWSVTYSGGAGTWATPNGHDATWAASGLSTREFLCIRNNPTVLRSQTDYQRVTMELSSKATRDRELFGLYDYCGANDIWLRISDATTSLSNITGIRIRWEGDGALSIVKFTSGTGVTLAALGTGGITPPGPGAQLIGEAGVLADGARTYFRAKIGESIRLEVSDPTAPYGAANRRWGHGGRAQGASLLVGQTKPGGVHFWNGMDQTTT